VKGATEKSCPKSPLDKPGIIIFKSATRELMFAVTDQWADRNLTASKRARTKKRLVKAVGWWDKEERYLSDDDRASSLYQIAKEMRTAILSKGKSYMISNLTIVASRDLALTITPT